MYLYLLYEDRNSLQLQLFKRFGILPTNAVVLRDLSIVDEELCNQLTPNTIASM